MVAAQQPATCNRDEPGIQIARDAMSCSRRPRLPIRIASAPRWRPARRRIFEERRHIGAVTQTPERQTPHCGWWGVRGSSIVWVDSILLPDPTGCQAGRRRFTQIPVIGPYPLLITATRARMTGCAARCRVARHREARYHRNLHQDEFGPTRAERMQALAGDAPSNRSSATDHRH